MPVDPGTSMGTDVPPPASPDEGLLSVVESLHRTMATIAANLKTAEVAYAQLQERLREVEAERDARFTEGDVMQWLDAHPKHGAERPVFPTLTLSALWNQISNGALRRWREVQRGGAEVAD